MDTAIVRQFLDFFQEFLQLCQLENWPDDNTSEQEIKNAFLSAQHIEKCLDRLQSRSLIDDFLSTLNTKQETSKLFVKNCFTDPSKYILKKIIQSNSKITQVDIGFKVFVHLFSEEKLEKYLADIMLETASKETLLRNLTKEFSRYDLLRFKSLVLLSELNNCEDPKDSVLDLLQYCNEETISLLVVSLLNKDSKYYKSVNIIVNAFAQIMLSKKCSDKSFWRLLFRVDDKYLVQLCLDHAQLFKLLSTALLDCGKLLREQMSADYFYIDLTYSELVTAVKMICQNENLKIEFLDIVRESNSDVQFWDSMIS